MAISNPPERQFITSIGGTLLFLSNTDEPWRLPAYALVLPMGPRAGMNGQLAQAYRRTLGPDMDDALRKLVRSKIGEDIKAERLQPDRPVLIPLPDSILWPKPEDTPSENTPRGHFIIAATAYETEQASLDGAAKATEALLQLAANYEVRKLILPTLGTGQGNLPSDQVMRAMVAAIQNSLLSRTRPVLQEITLVTRDESGTAAAFDFFTRRAQRLLNDLPQGGDLLNVAIEARTLAETLLLRDLEPPLSVAIIGGWGSGKSFIMHLMHERMTELRAQRLSRDQAWASTEGASAQTDLFPYVGHVYQINFDAWTYAKGDLWSSLMQTIFFELNRQISLEKRLREAYIANKDEQEDGSQFLLDGGEGWRALNAMNDDARDTLLKSNFPETYEKWKQTATATIDDVLWQELKKIKKEEREKLKEALQAKRDEITNEQNQLERNQQTLASISSSLKDLSAKDLTQQAQEEALRELPPSILKTLGINAFAQLERQLKAATDMDGNVGSIDLDSIRPNTARIFIDEVLKDPKKLRWFIFLIWIGTVAFFLAILVDKLVPQLVAFLTASGAYLVAGWRQLSPWISRVLGRIHDWDLKVQIAYEYYRKVTEKRHKELQEQTQKEISAYEARKKELEKDIAESKLKLDDLKTEFEQQRLRISPIASYDSLLEFVNSRLSGTYEKKLGFVHFVQRDLRELTNSLVADLERPERIPERMQELFPRGPARIVLFIDDLDRCPPDQVVQVLEAAQLLLKTELFVVVLAIDVRYVARALEKTYDKILVRRGKPSGLDYIEKIIQIPYRVRSIDKAAMMEYLRAQMKVEESVDIDTTDIPQTPGSLQNATLVARGTVTPARMLDIPPSRVLEFSQYDLYALHKSCTLLELNPRAIKRLINVSKIIKVVWFRTQENPTQDVIDGVFSLLALSDRFPDLMRDFLDEMATYWRMSDYDLSRSFCQMFNEFSPIGLTPHQAREWDLLRKMVNNTDLLSDNFSLDKMGLRSFNLVRSFCFVGDIGYDPDDERK